MTLQKKLRLILKWSTYVILFLLLYVLQTSVPLFEVFSVKPILLVPAAICLAIQENELAGGILGAFAGLLCDMASGELFGFNAVILLICCVGGSLVVQYLMKPNLFTAMVLGAGTLLIRGMLDYLFFYAMWNYEGSSHILVRYILPTVLYSLLVLPLFYLLFKKLKRSFDGALEE